LLSANPDMRILAGGTDIFPATRYSELSGETLDLTAITALSGVSKTQTGWRIGATTTWAEIITADLPPAFDGLKNAAREVGSVQIQNSGTIAGNICNASPAADGVPPLLTLNASVEIMSQHGHRQMNLSEFVQGVRKTALEPGEIVTAVNVPASSAKGRSAFLKLGARKYLVISIAMVAVRLQISAGRIVEAEISVGACSPIAHRLLGLETVLVGAAPDTPTRWQKALEGDIDSFLDPIDDIRADAKYRKSAVSDLVNQAINMVATT